MTNFYEVISKKSVQNRPPTLIDRSIDEVNAIRRHICNGDIQNFSKRIQQNVDTDGRHLRETIFQT